MVDQPIGRPGRRASLAGVLRLALDLPELAAADDGRLDRAESLPPIEAAVRTEHRIQQASRRQSHPIG